MAYDLRTPRSRGSLCGLALILLGGWAGLVPFAGPSFGFGLTPDLAWHYTSGRLYLSALPAAIVLSAGVIVTFTRSRWFGAFCAFLAAVAGVWLIVGSVLIRLLPASQVASITTGSPIGTGTTVHVLTPVAFYSGTGALIVFFSALAIGRFSMTAARDYGAAPIETANGAGAVGAGAAYGGFQAGQDMTTPEGYAGGQYGAQYHSGQETYPPGQYQGALQYPTERFPQAAGQYATPETSQGPFGLTQDWPTPGSGSQSPFPPAQHPGYQGQGYQGQGYQAGADQATTAEPTTAMERPPGQDPAPPGS